MSGVYCLRAGALVQRNQTTPNDGVVLDAQYLVNDGASELAADGWRYLHFEYLGLRYLVRPTGKTRYSRGWGTEIAEVEVRDVETLVREIDGRPVIVTGLGGLRRTWAGKVVGPWITRHENVVAVERACTACGEQVQYAPPAAPFRGGWVSVESPEWGTVCVESPSGRHV